MKHFLIFLLIFFLTIPSFGQDRAIVKHNGKVGYWFSLEVGDKILKDLVELSELKAEKQELLGKLKLKLEALDLKDLEVDNEKRIGRHWKEAYIEENALRLKETELYSKKLKDKDPWYKKPGFVFFGGTLVGALLAVGVAFGINWSVNKEF